MSQWTQARGETFIRMWQRGDSDEEIGKALGLAAESVRMKAAWFRKNGVRLRNRKRGPRGPSFDLGTLRRVAKFAKETSHRESP